jgi:ribosome-associated translation inhibitor RaiA
MLVQVSCKGFEPSAELRDHVEERILSALIRFTGRIARVNVFLSDENGPKHGRDKSLRFVIDIERLPLIVVEERGEAWHTVLDQAVERAVHAVSRHIDRIRSRADRTSMAGDIDESLANGSE